VAALGLLRGASRISAALRMLRRERSLWPYCAAPLALNVALFAGALMLFAASYGDLVGWLAGLLAVDDPALWYQWLWVGPLRAFAWLLRWIVIAAAALLVYLLFTVVGSVIAAPFLDLLSERVEALARGASPPVRGWRDSLRAAAAAAREDLKRAAFFLGVQIVIFGVGLVPGLQPFAGAAALLCTAAFLSLDYTAYVLDRHQIPFRARRSWLWQHRGGMLGFGGAALASFLVPGLNFLCLPVLVTGGTLLALEAGVPRVS